MFQTCWAGGSALGVPSLSQPESAVVLSQGPGAADIPPPRPSAAFLAGASAGQLLRLGGVGRPGPLLPCSGFEVLLSFLEEKPLACWCFWLIGLG